ncbi:hypothetical protein VNO77_34268 [Canavalia gladiata]|uniref:Uncharacterized protein n=1 Tax=Canavalia gladiata TaxID=3824 RepID=A0AAN9KDB3_CANGL
MPEQPGATFFLSVVDAVRCLPCLGLVALVMFLTSTFAGPAHARRFASRDGIHYSCHAVGACSKAKLASSACPRDLRSEIGTLSMKNRIQNHQTWNKILNGIRSSLRKNHLLELSSCAAGFLLDKLLQRKISPLLYVLPSLFPFLTPSELHQS